MDKCGSVDEGGGRGNTHSGRELVLVDEAVGHDVEPEERGNVWGRSMKQCRTPNLTPCVISRKGYQVP